MKKFKASLTGIMLLAVVFALPAQTMAQWSLGASYQMRDEAPENGFGVRLEREILQGLPLVDLGIRAHFAYFSEGNNLTVTGENKDITFGEVKYYNYGLSAVAGVSVGFIKPYVGLGLGASTIDIKVEDVQGAADSPGDQSDTKFYWTGFVGAELTIIPKLHPFIEYRFEPVDEAGDAFNNVSDKLFDSNGTLLLGLELSF